MCRFFVLYILVTLLNCLRDVGTRGVEPTSTNSSMMHPSATQTSAINARRRRTTTRKLQPLTVFCTSKGITFHVHGTSKQSQASIDLPSTFFSMFRVQPSSGGTNGHNGDDSRGQASEATGDGGGGEFCVNLTTLLECLSLVGSGTSGKGGGVATDRDQHNRSTSSSPPVSLTMTYHLSSELLKIEMEESAGGMLCTFAIPGMMAPDDNDDVGGMAGAFLASPTQAQILLPSVQLSVILPELEYVAGATVAHVGIRTSPEEQNSRQRMHGRGGSRGGGLELGTIGHAGQCWLSLQHGKPASARSRNGKNRRRGGSRRRGPFGIDDGNDEGDDDGIVRYTYPLHRFLQSMKALDIASETCLSINQEGMMAIQHQIFLQDSDAAAFCDFVLVALEEDSEDEDDPTTVIYEDDQEDETTIGDGTLSSASSSRLSHSQLSSSQTSSLPPRSKASRRPRRNTRKDEASEAMEDTNTHQADSSSTDDEDDKDGRQQDDEGTSPSLVAPLFGTVVNGQSLSVSSSTPIQQAEARRRQRRMRRRLSRGTATSESFESPSTGLPSRSTQICDGSPSGESVDLLNDDDEDRKTSSTTSRAATRQLSMSEESPPQKDRRGRKLSQQAGGQSQDTLNEPSHYRHPDDYQHEDECPSSPELVYGQQY